jgi:hypothetical protein
MLLRSTWFLSQILDKQNDDQILNLGPFEQQFNENRAFFRKEQICSVRKFSLFKKIGDQQATHHCC